MSMRNQQSLAEFVAKEAARAALWGIMLFIVLTVVLNMAIEPYASKFKSLVGSAVLVTTGIEVHNLTNLSPDQAIVFRSKVKQTIKEGIDFGFGQWQKRVRQVASDPKLKQDLKEAIEFATTTWHQKARKQ